MYLKKILNNIKNISVIIESLLINIIIINTIAKSFEFQVNITIINAIKKSQLNSNFINVIIINYSIWIIVLLRNAIRLFQLYYYRTLDATEIVKYSLLYLIVNCKLLFKLFFNMVIKMEMRKELFLELLRAVQSENAFV